MWKATFSWHVEDMDLYGINFLHYGKPKTWYCVPPKYGHLLERAARQLFPNVAAWCSNFMRHKTCLISPSLLDSLGVPYQRVVQETRDIIIVFPYAYHAGFNHGYNIAESTNFATKRWIEYGKRHRPCDCSRNKVHIDMAIFVKRFQPELYEDWLMGKDIKHHPEDPPDVAKEIAMKAKDPISYAKMMSERLKKQEMGANKHLMPVFTTCKGKEFHYDIEEKRLIFFHPKHQGVHRVVTLEDEEEKKRFEKWKAELHSDKDESDSIVLDVYRHTELQHLKASVFTDGSYRCTNLAKIRDILGLPYLTNIAPLIENGDFIKIGQRCKKRKVEKSIKLKYGQKAVDKTTEKPMMNAALYVHVSRSEYMAIVDPFTMELVGQPSDILKAFLEGNAFSIAELIECGVFQKVDDVFIPLPERFREVKENVDENMTAPVLKDNKDKILKDGHVVLDKSKNKARDVYVFRDLSKSFIYDSDAKKIVGDEDYNVEEMVARGELVKIGHVVSKSDNDGTGNEDEKEENNKRDNVAAEKYGTEANAIGDVNSKSDSHGASINHQHNVKEPMSGKCNEDMGNDSESYKPNVPINNHHSKKVETSDLEAIGKSVFDSMTCHTGYTSDESDEEDSNNVAEEEDDDNDSSNERWLDDEDDDDDDDDDDEWWRFGGKRPKSNIMKKRKMKLMAKRNLKKEIKLKKQRERMKAMSHQINTFVDQLKEKQVAEQCKEVIIDEAYMDGRKGILSKEIFGACMAVWKNVGVVFEQGNRWVWRGVDFEVVSSSLRLVLNGDMPRDDQIDANEVSINNLGQDMLKLFVATEPGFVFGVSKLYENIFPYESSDAASRHKNSIVIVLQVLHAIRLIRQPEAGHRVSRFVSPNTAKVIKDKAAKRGKVASIGYQYAGPNIFSSWRSAISDGFNLRQCEVRLTLDDRKAVTLDDLRRFQGTSFVPHNSSNHTLVPQGGPDMICKCGHTEEREVIDEDGARRLVRIRVGNKRRMRCRKCVGCKTPKCNECNNCLKPSNKQACVMKKCLNPSQPKCPCFE